MNELFEIIKHHPGIAGLVALGLIGFFFFMIARAVSKLVWRLLIGAALGAAAGAVMQYFVCPFFGLPSHWAAIVAVVFFLFGLIFKKIPGVG